MVVGGEGALVLGGDGFECDLQEGAALRVQLAAAGEPAVDPPLEVEEAAFPLLVEDLAPTPPKPASSVSRGPRGELPVEEVEDPGAVGSQLRVVHLLGRVQHLPAPRRRRARG